MNDLFETDKDITAYTTFGIPVKAKYFAEYSNLKELIRIFRSPEYQENEHLHIGGGSNLLFLHDYNGLILHSGIKGIVDYRKNEHEVFVISGAGEKWTDLVDHCVENGFAGLENLAGIPGEVGASPVQNVGAYGAEAGDFIHAVECFDAETGKTVTFKGDECGFGYRTSRFKTEWKGKYIVLRVSFRLKVSDTAENMNYGPLRRLAEDIGHVPTIKEVRDEVIRIRSTKLPDPLVTGSAGSFFKNPVVSEKFFEQILKGRYPEMPVYRVSDDSVKLPAGWLIEHAGLKGYRVGGAEVYPHQCLVIANAGGASAKDVVALCNVIKKRVRRLFAVTLKPEVNFIDSSIEVTVLGSGTSKGVPEIGCDCEVCQSEDAYDKRLRASVLVRTRGTEILIDPSPDLREQALRENLADIDGVLITHEHYDHVGGIDDLRVFTADHNLMMYMKKDVAEDIRSRLDYCFRPSPYPGVPSLKIEEVNPDEVFRVGDVFIEPIPVFHGKLPILGFRIGNFAYITDASSIPLESMEKLEGLDVLILNSLRKTKHFAHFSLEESLDVIKKLKPRKAYLTHLSHEIGRHSELAKELPGNVFPAYDGLKIVID